MEPNQAGTANGRMICAYANDLFATDDPALNQQRLNDIQWSGLNSLILWPIHLEENGDMNYGDDQTPIVQGGVFLEQRWSYLPPLLAALRSSGAIQVIHAGTGGAPPNDPETPDDYRIIKKLLGTEEGRETLRRNFGALAQALNLDGYELDFEDGDSDTSTTVNFSLLLAGLGLGVSYCPYEDMEFWRDCLAGVFAGNNEKQIVRWLNLQCYAGGAFEVPSAWVSFLRASQTAIGVGDPAAFVHPGLWTLNVGIRDKHCVPVPESGVYCPNAMTQKFAEFKKGEPGLTSAFIWNLAQIYVCAGSGGCQGEALTVKAYANAMIDGLK